MSKNEVALRPSYWASVSGGKDSLYMLNLILHNLDKYQLDGVVHFELEIDYPFIKDVIDYMESECQRYGIPFVRIKPRKTWEELYYEKVTSKSGRKIMRGFPNRRVRWCNKYKLDSKRQLDEWLNSLGCYVVTYIGYCVDEEKRYSKRSAANKTERYPLVEEGIYEDTILDWAKTEPIFNHYYETNRRCGCMYCPLASRISFAYLYKYYPQNWEYMIDKMKETEKMRSEELGRPCSAISSDATYNAEYLEKIVKEKWLPILEHKEKYHQISLTELMKGERENE